PGFEKTRVHNPPKNFWGPPLGRQPIEVDETGYLQIYVNSPSNWNSSDIINADPSRATYLYFNNNASSYPPPLVTYDLTANTFSFINISAGADNVTLLINNLDTPGA